MKASWSGAGEPWRIAGTESSRSAPPWSSAAIRRPSMAGSARVAFAGARPRGFGSRPRLLRRAALSQGRCELSGLPAAHGTARASRPLTISLRASLPSGRLQALNRSLASVGGSGRLEAESLARLAKTWAGRSTGSWARRLLRKLRHAFAARQPRRRCPHRSLARRRSWSWSGRGSPTQHRHGGGAPWLRPRGCASSPHAIGWPNEKARIAPSGANLRHRWRREPNLQPAALTGLNWVAATRPAA